MTAVRARVEVLAVHENATAPLPVPFGVTVSHGALLDAVQADAELRVNVKVLPPAPGASTAEIGDTLTDAPALPAASNSNVRNVEGLLKDHQALYKCAEIYGDLTYHYC